VSGGGAETAAQVALGGENGIDPYVALNGFYVQVAASVSAPTLFAAFFDGNNAIGRAGVLQGFAAGYADVDTGLGAAGFSAGVGLNGGFSIALPDRHHQGQRVDHRRRRHAKDSGRDHFQHS